MVLGTLSLKRRLTFVVLMAILGTALFFTKEVQVLTLRTPENSNMLEYFAIVRPGDEVKLYFLHSYEKGWVEETYRIGDKDFIYPVEHRFQVFSYDMRELTYPGEFKMGDDGYAYVTNIDRYQIFPIKNWHIRVAWTVPQWLLVRKETISLPDTFEPGTSIVLNIELWSQYKLMNTKIAFIYKALKGELHCP